RAPRLPRLARIRYNTLASDRGHNACGQRKSFARREIGYGGSRAMRMETSLHQRLEQKLRLAPQIIQSIEILQLPALELQDLIKQEMLENPTLEVVEGDEGDTPAEADAPGDAEGNEAAPQPEPAAGVT